MTILIDRARWLWRGERWSHLASDSHPDELHEFAVRIGVRRLSFQGDHYDLPQRRLATAIEQGATLVDSRDLVRRLREAGLRHRRSMGWDRRVWWEGGNRGELTRHLHDAGVPPSVTCDIDLLDGVRQAVVLHRPTEWGIGLTLSAPSDLSSLDPAHRRWEVTSSDGHHVDWFVPDRPTVGS